MKISLHLDDIGLAMADAAQRFCEDHAARLPRSLPAADRRFDPQTWRQLCEMGWLQVALPESAGGMGLQAGALAVMAHAVGARGLNEPWASGVLATSLLSSAASQPQAQAWLHDLLEGSLCVACAVDAQTQAVETTAQGRLSGCLQVVLDADIAELLIFPVNTIHGKRWHALRLDGAGVQRQGYLMLDGRGAATVTLQSAVAIDLGSDDTRAYRLIAFLSAADALGAMERAFDLTLDYVKTRKQFGVTLGSNQVIAHRTVDLFMQVQESRAALAHAARALKQDNSSADAAVHAAKAFIGPLAQRVAQEAVQLHGGIGVTEEYEVSHCLRRVLVDLAWGGAPRQHLIEFMQYPQER